MKFNPFFHAATAGRSNGTFTFSYVVGATTGHLQNLNIRTLAASYGWNQAAVINLDLTVNSGYFVYGSTTAIPAIDMTNLPTGSKVKLTNNGTIVGAGGHGGHGGSDNYPFTISGENGYQGGTAITCDASTHVDMYNNGSLLGGGGGGGGGDGFLTSFFTQTYSDTNSCNPPGYYTYAALPGGGGGGGAGYLAGVGAGGLGYADDSTGVSAAGAAGSWNAGGAGGNMGRSGYDTYARGGSGGVAGSAGSAGQSPYGAPYYTGGSYSSVNGSGGAAGYYINGNSNITWYSTGTRLGLSI